MPSTNPPAKTVLARALGALAHPITVTCVLMLLLNDHVLRLHWPSWATGKLGDVAWLAFAPLVVALPLAILAPRLTPRRSRRAHSRTAIGLALALVGAVFAVVKALPAATTAFSHSFRAVFGWTPRIVCDPTDLLTLPALALAYWIWMRAGEPRSPRVRRTRRVRIVNQWPRGRRRGWAVLALAALATLGNSGPPDEGIVCLKLDGDRILAGPRHSYAFTNTFASHDGGLTWTMIEDELASEAEVICAGRTEAWPVTGADGETFRLVSGRRIERSDDDGATWITEVSLSGEDARLAYYQHTRMNYGAAAGPHDVLIVPSPNPQGSQDPQGSPGHIIVAMGLEGVLVRTAPSADKTAPGIWTWQAVGPYCFEPLTTIAQLYVVLQGELGLAAAAGFIALAMAGWRTYRWPLRVLSVVVALGTALTQLVFHPAITSNYGTMMAGFAVLAGVGAALIVGAIGAILQVRRRTTSPWRLAGLWLWSSLLYLAPFVIWARGWITPYIAAAWIAVIFTVATWAASALTPRPFHGDNLKP
jgi:hypothetical protein